MNIIEIINDKKQHKQLSQEQINYWIKGVVNKSIPNYQSSALLMAITLNGLDKQESYYLTQAMADSGESIDLSCFGRDSADKHSSGGVGDSTTFVVLPIVVACGMVGAKMSGRGLGWTGGTLDKIESITGFDVSLNSQQFMSLLHKNKIVLAGQTSNIAPADKELYSLRDVTGTVDSIGLIASSIMSKKLASGSHNIVLDVKCGKGAFMSNIQQAKQLAELMVDIGKQAGRNICAVITNMDYPLSNYVGNALEVYGAIQVLNGSCKNSLYEVSCFLASKLLEIWGVKNAMQAVEDAIKSKKALNVFRTMIDSQGGDVALVDNPELLLNSKYCYDIIASQDGYVVDINAIHIAKLCQEIGGGRIKVDDSIDLSVGVILECNVGKRVKNNDIIAKVMYNNINDLPRIIELENNIIAISNEKPKQVEYILDIID